MKGKAGQANKKIGVQSGSDRGTGKNEVIPRKSTSMPNPVKGLRLSLYPMVKEH